VKSIAWMTFVLTLALALMGAEKTSFDQPARKLANANEQRLRALDDAASPAGLETAKTFSQLGAALGRTTAPAQALN
jgi:hypothetical protein